MKAIRSKNYAGVAQLVEHNVANVVVVGSSLITRSCRTVNLKVCRSFFI